MKKTLLAIVATSLFSGGALAAAVTESSSSFSVSWEGEIPIVEKTPSGWSLKDGDETATSLTKDLIITRNENSTASDVSDDTLALSAEAFTITAAADTAGNTLDGIDVYLASASINGLTPEAGADPVDMTFNVGGQDMKQNEEGNSYTKTITASPATPGTGDEVTSLAVGFSGTVEADEWDAENDTEITVSATFVVTAGI